MQNEVVIRNEVSSLLEDNRTLFQSLSLFSDSTEEKKGFPKESGP